MEIEFEGAKLRVHENGTIERWYYNKTWKLVKGSNCHGHLQIKINGKKYFIHRIIAMVFLGLIINDTTEQIDHINRIRDDNRVENLRIVNNQENQFNTKHKGLYKKENGTYKAYIGINGKQFSKTFKTEAEAINWRNEQKIIYHSIIR